MRVVRNADGDGAGGAASVYLAAGHPDAAVAAHFNSDRALAARAYDAAIEHKLAVQDLDDALRRALHGEHGASRHLQRQDGVVAVNLQGLGYIDAPLQRQRGLAAAVRVVHGLRKRLLRRQPVAHGEVLHRPVVGRNRGHDLPVLAHQHGETLIIAEGRCAQFSFVLNQLLAAFLAAVEEEVGGQHVLYAAGGLEGRTAAVEYAAVELHCAGLSGINCGAAFACAVREADFAAGDAHGAARLGIDRGAVIPGAVREAYLAAGNAHAAASLGIDRGITVIGAAVKAYLPVDDVHHGPSVGQDGVRSAGDGYAAAADFELTVHDADGGLVRGAEVPALDAERAACELDELVYVVCVIGQRHTGHHVQREAAARDELQGREVGIGHAPDQQQRGGAAVVGVFPGRAERAGRAAVLVRKELRFPAVRRGDYRHGVVVVVAQLPDAVSLAVVEQLAGERVIADGLAGLVIEGEALLQQAADGQSALAPDGAAAFRPVVRALIPPA